VPAVDAGRTYPVTRRLARAGQTYACLRCGSVLARFSEEDVSTREQGGSERRGRPQGVTHRRQNGRKPRQRQRLFAPTQ
jgi:hypothetical protein